MDLLKDKRQQKYHPFTEISLSTPESATLMQEIVHLFLAY